MAKAKSVKKQTPKPSIVENPEVGDDTRPANKKSTFYNALNPKPGKKEPKQSKSRFDEEPTTQ